VPDRLVVPMKYAESVTLSSPGGHASYVFSQNSVYDPNVTSTGGSATGFAPLSGLYARYRVLSSRIRVTAQSGSTAAPVAIAVAPSITSLSTTSYAETVAQLRNAKPDILRLMPAMGYGPSVVLVDSVKTSQLLGDNLYDEVAFYGGPSSDPPQQFYWNIGATSTLDPTFGIVITVELEYVTEWSEPFDIPA